VSADAPRYVFEPLEQRGVLAGIRAGQLALIAGGLILAVGALALTRGLLGPVAALALAVTSAAVAFASFGGRGIDEWVAPVAHHSAHRLSGRHTTRAARDAPVRLRPPRRSHPGPVRPLSRSPVRPPALLAPLRMGEIDGGPGRRRVGVIEDRLTGLLCAVLSVRGRSFALLDAADKQRRLAAWGSILAALAREGAPVCRLQWIERSVAGDATALVRYHEQHGKAAAESTLACSYGELIAEAGPASQDHECHVVLAVSSRPARFSRSRASGAGLEPGQVLLREVRLLEGQLRSAEIDVHAVLRGEEIAAALRGALAPDDAPRLIRRAAESDEVAGPGVARSDTGASLANVWPAASHTAWSWWRADDCFHATYWVAEWPRTEIGPDFLGPLLLNASGHCAVAVVMGPVSPSRGVREAEAARTAVVADEELRRRAGFLGTARRRRQAEGVARRESELSDGHASYRFSGYVTVSGGSLASLEESCAEVVQAAHQCRLELRRLYGAQDVAFAWTLPLARGLR